jgi:two-component system, NtrC family, sensor histidine kinase HydH
MSRRILAQVTAPAAGIGLLLFLACLTSAWYINNLQTNLSQVLKQNVDSAKASQQMEVTARKLRFNCFLYLIRPNPQTMDEIKRDEKDFEQWLKKAAATCQGSAEEALIDSIRQGYEQYRDQFDALRAEPAAGQGRQDYLALASANPVGTIADPCRKLLDAHDERALATADESERISSYLRLAMLLLGLAGPLGGILTGYGIARGLSRSIYRLSVRVKDISQHLEHDVGSVSVSADTDIHSLDGQLERVVRRVEQVAERLQRQQRELFRTEQLSTVGKLAASVAHEIRNPLTSVKILVGLALRRQNPKPLTEDDLRVIHDELGRVENTVQHLLDFARLPQPQRSPCDLRGVVEQAADLVRSRAQQQGVELRVPAAREPITAAVDREQIRSVLVNLLLNALDAMPGGGRLEIELWPALDGGVRVRVADTGPGIPDDVLDRLFEPFVSTKATGTGLGLSISRRIVEEHEGTICVQNRPEGGACFTIRLPALAVERRHADVVDR